MAKNDWHVEEENFRSKQNLLCALQHYFCFCFTGKSWLAVSLALMLTGLGWLSRILSRFSKDWREQCSWGSFSDLLTSLSRQMLDEIPCLKWKSPQGILAVPHLELTSAYYWTPCWCFPQHHPPTLSFHKVGYGGLLHFCHATTSRSPLRFPSLLLPCYPLFGGFMCHSWPAPVFSHLLSPLHSPSQKMILALSTARRRTSKTA